MTEKVNFFFLFLRFLVCALSSDIIAGEVLHGWAFCCSSGYWYTFASPQIILVGGEYLEDITNSHSIISMASCLSCMSLRKKTVEMASEF